MTDMDLNQMVDDIYDQDQPKKPVNDLRDIGKYNTELSKSKQHDAENIFNTVYRTPQNTTIDLLIPKDYEVINNIEDDDGFMLNPMALGYYQVSTDKIKVRPKEHYEKVVSPEHLKYNTQERFLIHENTHK